MNRSSIVAAVAVAAAVVATLHYSQPPSSEVEAVGLGEDEPPLVLPDQPLMGLQGPPEMPKTPMHKPITVTKEDQEVSFSIQNTPTGPRAFLTITDRETGRPVSDLTPRSWLSTRRWEPALEPVNCAQRVSELLRGSLARRADVDFNHFWVLLFNDDNTLTVLNPQLRSSQSRLVSIMRLPEAPGATILDPEGRWLFIALSQSQEVLMLDTDEFKVRASIELPEMPDRLAIAPDGRTLFVGSFTDTVSLIDVATRKLIRHLQVGQGPHRFAFSRQGELGWVAANGDEHLRVLDMRSYKVLGGLSVGPGVNSLKNDGGGGLLLGRESPAEVLRLDLHERILDRLALGGALDTLEVDPSGRWAFAVDQKGGRVSVVGLEHLTLLGAFQGLNEPRTVHFTSDFAYLTAANSTQLAMLNLDELSGGDVALHTFSVGQAEQLGVHLPRRADSDIPMAISPNGEEIFLASPTERAIFVYRQGESSPLGQITNRIGTPGVVQLLDRSIQEESPGVYSAALRVLEPGIYDVKVGLNGDQETLCFQVEIPEPKN